MGGAGPLDAPAASAPQGAPRGGRGCRAQGAGLGPAPPLPPAPGTAVPARRRTGRRRCPRPSGGRRRRRASGGCCPSCRVLAAGTHASRPRPRWPEAELGRCPAGTLLSAKAGPCLKARGLTRGLRTRACLAPEATSLTSAQADPLAGAVPTLPPGGPVKTYHFSSPDVKGPRLRLLEHLGGDLCPQAAGAVQGPDVQVGVNALKEGQGSGALGSLGPPLGPGCALPVWGLGWRQGGRARWAPRGPCLTGLSCFSTLTGDTLCPLGLPPALPGGTWPRAGAAPHVEGLLQQFHDVGRVFLQHAQRGHGEVLVQLLRTESQALAQ